ncbi:hypothetical protein FA13DRAFT_1779690 [Coprinellus micaceus]|uniref:Uncharacterized protein n=1 Tax=Coprinellus micaceus TaxID=71717 RepID=A0A4Y7SFX8_COPMI|nr:hypothetical protein FA13DRAFT_1779690 [Coprinellus micaceus]
MPGSRALPNASNTPTPGIPIKSHHSFGWSSNLILTRGRHPPHPVPSLALWDVVKSYETGYKHPILDQLATCRITTTPSNTPNGGSLLDEFIIERSGDNWEIVFNREYSNDIPPGSAIITGSTTFSGPSGGAYVVIKTTGATTLTADQTRDIMRAWAGQSFAGGGFVGVNNPSCTWKELGFSH